MNGGTKNLAALGHIVNKKKEMPDSKSKTTPMTSSIEQLLNTEINEQTDQRFILNEFKQRYPDYKFDNYEVVGILGKGAQGLVFEVKDENEQHYAAKVILGKLRWQEYNRKIRAVTRGIKIHSKLDNPHFTKYVDLVESDDKGMFISISDIAEGKSLTHIVEEEGGKLSAERLVPIMYSTLEGLDYLHNLNGEKISHRDVKSDHIIVNEKDNFATLIDMDTSKGEDEGDSAYTAVGTFECRHPGQEIGETDTRFDLYSVGCVMLKSLLGKVPNEVFTSRNYGGRRYESPQDIPFKLRRIVDKLLNADIDQNYNTAREVMEDLEKAYPDFVRREGQLISVRSKGLTIGGQEINLISDKHKKAYVELEKKINDLESRKPEYSLLYFVGLCTTSGIGLSLSSTTPVIVPIAFFGLAGVSALSIPGGRLYEKHKLKRAKQAKKALELKMAAMDPEVNIYELGLTKMFEDINEYYDNLPDAYGIKISGTRYMDGSYRLEVNKKGYTHEYILDIRRNGDTYSTEFEIHNNDGFYHISYETPFGKVKRIYFSAEKKERGSFNLTRRNEKLVLTNNSTDYTTTEILEKVESNINRFFNIVYKRNILNHKDTNFFDRLCAGYEK